MLTYKIFGIFEFSKGRKPFDAAFPFRISIRPGDLEVSIMRIDLAAGIARCLGFIFGFSHRFYLDFVSLMPNKSPEPMRVGAVSSAIAGDDFRSRMAQLFSLGIIHVMRFIHAFLFMLLLASSAILPVSAAAQTSDARLADIEERLSRVEHRGVQTDQGAGGVAIF